MKVIFSKQDHEEEQIRKRMDRFDSIIHEYLRSNHVTVEKLSQKVGCDPSTLWRYRKKPGCFERAPISVIGNCLRIANVSNDNLRYILGLQK